MKKTLLSLFLTIGTFSLCIAQISSVNRIEIELKDGYSNEKIIEFGKNGFVLRAENNEVSDGNQEWKYDIYSTDLVMKKSVSISLDKKLYPSESFTDKTKDYTFFKDRKNNFSLVTFDVETSKITKVDDEFPKKTYVSEMTASGDFTYFKSTVNGFPFLFIVNWKTGEQKLINITLEGVNPKKSTLKHIQLLESTKEVFLFVSAINSKKTSDLFVIKLDEKGNKLSTFKLSQEDTEKNLIEATACKIGTNEYAFTGTYSSSSNYTTQGIFFAKVKNEKVSFIEFYNYLDLNNFLNYLPEKMQDRIEKKQEKKEENGKELSINYNVVTHDVIIRDNGYILIGEAYYATYRTEYYYTTSTVNGVTTTVQRSRQVFDGYQYTHAFIVKFDLNGKKTWDQTFELWAAYKPYSVIKFIQILEDNKKDVAMAFSTGSRVYTKTFNDTGNIIKDEKSATIETLYANDSKVSTYSSSLKFWYDNFYIASGAQRIKNKEDKNVEKKRSVYYVSKIKY